MSSESPRSLRSLPPEGRTVRFGGRARTDMSLEPEDSARADFYALLARLFAAAPDAPLLAAIAGADPLEPAADLEDANGIAPAWASLCAASAIADPVAVEDEYQALFVGVGQSAVSLYASHYLGPQSGRPLAEIRADARGPRPRPATGKQRVRGSPRRPARSDADAGRRRRRPATRDHRGAARILRAISDVVGLRLLHCNTALPYC